ncbi:MAG: lysophospholipid acyltransferase family protein [Chloroflexota bacterium]|nr:1-acyl-sn-glycerol-3-phosphate acyltransferase [Chloroflexota bacterium]MBI5702828.1 1-acyl-sn-glycerol-3-phosphate acyltransferase [Chloroflexota bacterium]
MLYHFTRIIIKLGTELLCRIDAPNLDAIPQKGPLIVITNHTGQLEVPVFFGQLATRPVTAWAKMEAWDNAFLRWLFNLWRLIPVRRGEADTSALRQAMKALEDGYIFGIAPEGTRNKTGRLKRAHPGAVMLAVHSGAPILPVAHWGGENFLRNLARLKRTDFHIRVGKPFKLELDGVKMTREVRQQIADEMMLRIAELLPPEYRGEYEKVTPPEKPFTRVVE